MRLSRYWLIGGGTLGILLLAAGTTAALNLDLQEQIPPPTPSAPDPTDRDTKLKEEEAARPTPTAVPAVGVCPTQADTCGFGLALASVLAGPESILSLAMPVSIQCPTDGLAVALQPVCARGGVQSGFFTGVIAKTWGFQDGAEFEGFVESTLDPSSRPRLMAIGCPQSDGSLNCDTLAAYTFSGDVEGQVLVVLTLPDEEGARRVVGARRWAFTENEVRGGTIAEFGQPGLPYQGPVYFQPVALP